MFKKQYGTAILVAGALVAAGLPASGSAALTEGNSQYFYEPRADSAAGGSLVYTLDGKWSDKYFYYPTIASQKHDPDPLLAQDAFAVFNAHITWHVDDNDRLSLQLSALNGFDKEYSNHGLPIANASGQRLEGRPRSYLFSVKANF